MPLTSNESTEKNKELKIHAIKKENSVENRLRKKGLKGKKLWKEDTRRNKSSSHVFKWNKANFEKDEPVEASSHGDSKENIGQISSIEQQKLHHCLEQDKEEER